MSNIVEDFLPRSFQASLSVSIEMASVDGMMQAIEKGEIGRFLPLNLDGRNERRGNEIHHDHTNFVVNILLLSVDALLLIVDTSLLVVDAVLLIIDAVLLIVDPLLQRSLAKVSQVVETKSSMYKPDTPSSHHESPQPDPRVWLRSQCC